MQSPLPRLHRPTVPPGVIDLTVAALLAALTLFDLATHELEAGQQEATPLAAVLIVLMCAPIALHRRHPAWAAIATSATVVVYSALHLPAYPGFVLFVLLYVVVLHADRRTAWLTAACSTAALVVSLAMQTEAVVNGSTWVASLLALAVAGLLAANLRARRAKWAALEARALEREAERAAQARQAVAAERLRIARELHDVVAHSMSVIAVQSNVGHHMIGTDPAEAQRALAAIQSTSRSALEEMRRLLGVLRQDDEPQGALTPAPGLHDVATLVADVERAGVAVRLSVDGDDDARHAGVEASAYRIVQEALTNVLKHGGGEAGVSIARTDRDVSLEVVDCGRGTNGTAPWARPVTSGHGIIGMRERVSVYGGDFEAGPLPEGGFRVRARLPLGRETP